MMISFKKQLLIQLGIFFSVIVLATGATRFMASELGKTALKIQNQKSELALRIRATDSLAALKSDFEKAKPLFGVLNSILPPKDQLINFGKDLIDLGKQNKIDLGFSFGGETPSTTDTPGFIRFSITAQSGYGNLVKFLKDVEKNRLYIKFNSLDLTRIEGGDKFNLLANGQVFFQ